jgi:hypothetical protein
MRASTVGLAILNPLRCRIGRTEPSRAGFQKFVRVPTGGQRSSFSLAVADDAGDDQMRIVEGRAISVEQGIPRPGATSDRARSSKGSLSTGRAMLHRMVDEWEGVRSRLSICVFGVVIFSRHQKGGRNGFLAGSPDCHSSSDRDHGRCLRALSRLFVNGSSPSGAGSPPESPSLPGQG